MTSGASFDLRVFYLWEPAATSQHDPGFGHEVAWDVPLLDGYPSEVVPNRARRPGSDRLSGINNPELLKQLKTWRPDAALLIGYRYASMLRLILTPERLRGFPLIFRGDSHRLAFGRSESLKAETVKEKLRRWGIGSVYARFAAFTFVGQANREYFRLHGVPDEKLFFAPHAVDNARFKAEPEHVRRQAAEWREALGINPEHLLVLFAGKFEEKKRPLELLEAFRRLGKVERSKEKVENVSLLFVGAGKLEPELQQTAAGVANVFFAPFQNQSFMPRTYAACDLFVLPSFGPEETWGLAINEAMCLARPVIVSDHVGCAPDLVRQGQNGLVFKAGDVGALAAALSEALSDRERLVAWGNAGRDIVSEYSYENATAGLETALHHVTNARNGGARASR